MAMARQNQSNAMLYTVITFVGLFILTTILAVVFYLKAEEQRNMYETAQEELTNIASARELRNINAIVGQKERNSSRLGQMTKYLDQLYKLLAGAEPQETSAEVKVAELEESYNNILIRAGEGMGFATEPNGNGPGTFRMLEVYSNKLEQKQNLVNQLTGQLKDLHSEYDIARQGGMQKEEDLLKQIRIEQKNADSVQQSYNQLRDLMNKKTTEQVQMLMKQRDEALDEKNKTRQELLATLSKLNITQNRMKNALSKLEILKPHPKEDIAAYQPDGKIITIETSANIVFLNIGSQDKVYPGLTFSVYDRNAPIPTNGLGKAEIEVFDVDKNTSIARIVKSNKKNPIIEDDIIVNLVWDSKAINTFVVAGEFDFDNDGKIDTDGANKIKQLIENWDSKVEKRVTIDTDFVVLGAAPRILPKPSLDTLEVDPMATDKYEASLKNSENYRQVKAQAKDLYIPVFGLKRFLNFIGYKAIATRTNLSAR